MSERKAPYHTGTTADDELVVRLAFMLAGEIREIERQVEARVKTEEDDFWRQFLQGEGLADKYRKAITRREMSNE